MPINSPDIFDSIGDAVVTGGGSGSDTFVGLTDTPATYSGSQNMVVVVNAGGTGLTFETNSGGISNFVSLSDTPSNYVGQSDKVVVVNAGETGLSFIDQVTPIADTSTFVALNDTPSNYTSKNNNFVQVNNGATGLVFTSVFIVSTFLNLDDTPSNYTGKNKFVTRVNSGASGLEFIAPTFLDDIDTPSTYVGEADKFVVVNSAQTGLTFVSESAGSKVLTSNISVSGQIIQKLYTTGQGANPQTLVTGVSGKIIVPLSITYIATRTTGTQEGSGADLLCGYDAVNSQSAGARWTSVPSMMNGKPSGTYTYTPMGLNVSTDFTAEGLDFMLWTNIAFNGKWSMEIYFSYILIDA